MHQSTHSRLGEFTRIGAGLAGLVCLGLGLAIAGHHPLGSLGPLCAVTIIAAASGCNPRLWLYLVPGLLPVIGLAPWTGWITFEELDLLVLSVGAGGYLRHALEYRAPEKQQAVSSSRALAWTVASLFAVTLLVSMVRGFADAGGFTFGWYQGYHEPMNSVRLSKSFFLAFLVAPLWQITCQRDRERARNALSTGMLLGLIAASMSTIWERFAFPGLFNFSTDYRTTGMFWEMHVGGAALDGFLALTLPFAVGEMLREETRSKWALAVLATALGVYACMTTFSRGVYLAVPAALAVLYWTRRSGQLRLRGEAPGAGPASAHNTHWWAGLLLVAGFTTFAGWMFPTSGYRGAFALLGALTLLTASGGLVRRLSTRQILLACAIGSLLSLCGLLATLGTSKGAYFAYAFALVFTLVACWRGGTKLEQVSFAGVLAVAGQLMLLSGAALVAYHWGKKPALVPAVSAAFAGLLLLCGTRFVRRPLWPESRRWQIGVLGGMATSVLVIGIFGGGAYMGGRFSTGSSDMTGRLGHWKLGASMLETPADWWFGKGAGRFPANYFLVGDPKQHPGDYRLAGEGSNTYLKLTGGLHVMGWGELFRVSQRVSEVASPALVSAAVRTDSKVNLHFEVCEKHLLYNGQCMIGVASVKGAPGQWQNTSVALKTGKTSRGLWFSPRLIAFSVAVETPGGIVHLDQIDLKDSTGRSLLSNGDFSDGMSHWFFSSDRHHMPWHIKSMFMHILFEQGILGLAIWGLMAGGALFRVTVGRAKSNPLAPAIAAGIAGFCVVGLFDSLLDVPRLAMFFYFVVLLGLLIPGKLTRSR